MADTKRTDALDAIREAVQDAGWHAGGSDWQIVELLARLAKPLQVLSAEYVRIDPEVRRAVLDTLD